MPVIDATVFMGMHHTDPQRRVRAVALIVSNFRGGLEISFDQIGICDSIVWCQPRGVQDAYYPFMDVLHTKMPFERHGYSAASVMRAASDRSLVQLRDTSPTRALLAASVIEEEKVLYTFDPSLIATGSLKPFISDAVGDGFFSIQGVEADSSGAFLGELQQLYIDSQVLTISDDDFSYV